MVESALDNLVRVQAFDVGVQDQPQHLLLWASADNSGSKAVEYLVIIATLVDAKNRIGAVDQPHQWEDV